tara:strand:- start:93 stop:512 length:420 start_codon:yes stop_codon:yes gene_type:complete
MYNLFKKKDKEADNIHLKTACLLIHAAKMDENYTNKEVEIIKKTLKNFGVKEKDLSDLIKNAEEIEKKSNQILDFTKEIKKTDEKFKVKLVETLWEIIYSDNSLDIYESSLMRRLSGLLYLDNKLAGDIKEKIKKKFST